MPSGIYKHKKGRKTTEKTRKKIGKVMKKKWQNLQYRTKQIQSHLGKESSFKGKYHTEEAKRKMKEAHLGKYREEDSPHWKGDDIGYPGIHLWIHRVLGKPKICEHCGATAKERKLQWANKDHKYRRNLKDWMGLCVPCHKKYDRTHHR